MPIYHQQPLNDSPDLVERRPYQSFGCSMLHLGPIALYCRKEILEDEVQKLVAEVFDVRRLDASRWGVGGDAHEDMKRVLQLPSYYGRNLNALDECIHEVTIPDEGGMAIVLSEYDDF